MKYDHKHIEEDAQRAWRDEKIFDCNINEKKKFYVLDMFPYPSGDGLHVGHIKGYSASDLLAHYKRLNGYNVLHPMGWDAFGLPAENYALKVKKNPREVVEANIKKFKNQLESLGFSYDWNREVDTTDPGYYKFTQWIFIKLFEKGLAYQADVPINFCPSCKTGLANEEVISGECERCGTKVIRKRLRQWVLKITDYAERLLEDLDGLDWPQPIKDMQINWIGKSQGSTVTFDLIDFEEKIEVFTTRVDTLYGCTWIVLAPEHDLVAKITKEEHKKAVDEYLLKTQNKSDLERTELQKDKTGVFTGAYALNPINGEKIPVWIADYVLAGYGSGAVMAVPAHDERDFEFAKKYSLEVRQVISAGQKEDKLEQAIVEYGTLINSGEFNGLKSEEAKQKITEKLKALNHGGFTTNYRLRDWIFSRQRYWGEPIPVVHCEKCGTVAVREDELPIELPYLENYEPTGTGESPLAKVREWVETSCPKCGGKAERETNTMPQWAGSCWYYLRYADPKNNNELISRKADDYFMPVDFYISGAEHAVLHLLYARFWHKFLYDLGVVKDIEPFKKLKNVGLILAPDNQKMSKSRGNVINPDDIIEEYGADALRMYELFIGPFDQPASWNTRGISGTRKFLEKVTASFSPKEDESGADLQGLTNGITDKIEKNFFNTAISDFMKFSNEYDLSKLSISEWKIFLTLLSPFAPHLSEHLYRKINNQSVFTSKWPEIKETAKPAIYTIQINGKRKAVVEANHDENEDQIKKRALEIPAVSQALKEKSISKVIFVKNKIINFVV